MKRIFFILVPMLLLGWLVFPGFSQTLDAAPTIVPINEQCEIAPVNENTTRIRNGSFQESLLTDVGLTPRSWSGNGVLIADATRSDTETELRGLVMLLNGQQISQLPSTDNLYVRFNIRLCALVTNGQLKITFGRSTYYYPDQATVGTLTSTFKMDDVRGDLSANGKSEYRFTISFIATTDASGQPLSDAIAYVDNVQIEPNLVDSSGATPTPQDTPTPQPTSTPATPQPSPTPTPTLMPGVYTPTPTPGIRSDSVRMVANPPMLSLSPDDFVSTNSASKKQIALDLQIVGSNGEDLNILSIDPKATIKFTIDAGADSKNIGTLSQPTTDTGDVFETVSSRRLDLKDVLAEPLYFFPEMPYTGTVRIVVTIEYETDIQGKREKVKIQGVIPIYLRSDPTVSFTDVTGGFNPQLNWKLGRMPGDRGLPPPGRNNLLYRERMAQ